MGFDRRCVYTKQKLVGGNRPAGKSKFKLICSRGAASPKISVLTLIELYFRG